MTRQTVLLLFGGESSEHDVSISSAHNVYAAMDSEKYNVLLGYIDRRGKWWLLDAWTDSLKQHGGRQLLAALGFKGFVVLPGNEVVNPDVIFPILHGKHGEDGTVQGLAELLHIPIVGCDTVTSAVCIDKIVTKQVLEANGIKTAPYSIYQRGYTYPVYKKIIETLGSILFVKPARGGSSVGVSKVKQESEFLPAIKIALQYDNRILIESALDGRELETAVLGNAPHHKVSGIGEIISGAEFYDYDDKYSPNSKSQVLTNVELSPKTEAHIKQTSLKVYEILGCAGMARIDYILVGKVAYVIEVNTIPGFTNISMYPKLWRATGMHYPELIDQLINNALK
ncbi:MAG: D-alanine--D-alanine ligase family protein [Candidatus Saccharimonas sp.]